MTTEDKLSSRQFVEFSLAKKLIADFAMFLRDHREVIGKTANMLEQATTLERRAEAVYRTIEHGQVEAISLLLCKTWPKDPNGCAAICLDRLGDIGDCRHCVSVHGARAKRFMRMLNTQSLTSNPQTR